MTIRRLIVQLSRTRHLLAYDDADRHTQGAALPTPLPETKDPFILLGIDRSSAGDMSAIKMAYHRQAKAYHPDTSVTHAMPEDIKRRIHRDFSAINAAYEELRDSGGSILGSSVHASVASRSERSAKPHHVYGYGQSFGACFETSFDDKRRRRRHRRESQNSGSAKAARSHTQTSGLETETSGAVDMRTFRTGCSPGFAGFASDEGKYWSEISWAHDCNVTQDAKRSVDSATQPTHVGATASATNSASISPASAGIDVTSGATKQASAISTSDSKPVASPAASWTVDTTTNVSPRSFTSDFVAAVPDSQELPTEIASGAVDAEVTCRAEAVSEWPLAARERCRELETRLKRAEQIAKEAMQAKETMEEELSMIEQELGRSGTLAQACQRERDELLQRVKTMASAHSEEKQWLEQQIATLKSTNLEENERLERHVEALEAEMATIKRPWYNQAWQPKGYKNKSPPKASSVSVASIETWHSRPGAVLK